MVASDRYKEGKASNYGVLEAQPQLLAAESTLSRIEVGRRLTVVQLYKALGGGWSLHDSEWAGMKRAQGYRPPITAAVEINDGHFARPWLEMLRIAVSNRWRNPAFYPETHPQHQ